MELKLIFDLCNSILTTTFTVFGISFSLLNVFAFAVIIVIFIKIWGLLS